jgi:SAM-dependent methyltransferase
MKPPVRTPTTYNFAEAVQQWSKPPFTGFGYFSSKEKLEASPEELRCWFKRCARERDAWDTNGVYRRVMLGDVEGKDVLDFGCGMGLETTRLTQAGAFVCAADISLSNVALATAVNKAVTELPNETASVSGQAPFVDPPIALDIFFASGAVQSTPKIGEILYRAAELAPEARLMLHGPGSWTAAVGTPPPLGPVHEHPQFERYVRCHDSVGTYLDWFDRRKLGRLVGDVWNITAFEDIRPDTHPEKHFAVRMKRRG